MHSTTTPDHGAEILIRTIKPNEGGMPAEAARAMLEFKLSHYDRDRVNQLASKARKGALTAEEQSELEDYERVTALLELIQSKARVSLKQAGLSP
jgi:hypothetical protein